MRILTTLSAATLLLGISAAVQAQPGEILYPKALQSGDTIAIVAPAGPLRREPVMKAKERLEERGFKVVLPENLFRRDDYLAGTDQQRADELMWAFTNPEIDAIFPGTGGYGVTRMLDLLDFEKIKANPKMLIGFSDITGLHIAIHQQTGLVTFHSPNPMYGLGSQGLAPIAGRTFWRALLASEYQANGGPLLGYELRVEPTDLGVPATETFVPGVAEGRTIGGNLSLVHALMGTKYQTQTEGKVLFLEDVGEAPYRVDRMLQTMKTAGLLDKPAGVVLCGFTRREDEDTTGEEKTIQDVLHSFFDEAPYPVLANFPLGHQRNNCTLPVGVKVKLDATTGSITLLENPVTLPNAK